MDCVKLLHTEGAQVGVGAQDNVNALHFASMKGHKEVLRYLLNAGVSVNSRTRKGVTALHYAAQNGVVD